MDQPICTCPSGDGSLRWPCPAHPQPKAPRRADSADLFKTVRERDVERLLVQRVQAAGGQAYKFTSPGRSGVPDRIVLLPGRAPEFVELKRKGLRARPQQLREHERMRAAGAVVHVIDDAAGIDRLLEARP